MEQPKDPIEIELLEKAHIRWMEKARFITGVPTLLGMGAFHYLVVPIDPMFFIGALIIFGFDIEGILRGIAAVRSKK